MFRNITASIGNVVGRVVHPVVSLLQSAPGWFNRTTPGDHGPHHHHQHNFTVLNHTAYHPQSHHLRPHPHHQQHNSTAPKVNVVQKKLPSPGDVNPHRTCPFSRDASGPAASTEAPATAMPTPAVTTTVPHAVTTTGNPTTTGVPVLHSRLCGQAPAVPALRAYPFATANELATSIDGSTSEKSTSQVPQDIINATDTILPTTPTGGSVSLLEDRAEVTASTSAAATLLAASHTPLMPMPTGNATAGSTYLPAADTTSSQSFVPSTTSVVHTTAPSPTTVPLLKGTQTALPATRHLPTTPPSVESTSVVPQETPDAAPFAKAAFTWSPRRFA
ncbi:hypothetical protein HPB50_002956 [Hyalomma asiaticum]|uniref:Uncharacterized protein n=1 Tax=Hyalomma asiaticum TaxID=266040 RepID=A0ACB7SLR5_HYAAI|nr:hypothetical protein HPB50_002956 [Hyalomma asiaticum]